MLTALRHTINTRLETAIELTGFLVSLSGATAALVFGRLMLAVALGAVVLGFFFRLAGRRKARSAEAPNAPAWIYMASVLLSVVEVGLLVEATDLPVRFYQEGFALHHWALVLAALVAAFWVQLALLRAVANKCNTRHVR